MTDNTEPGSRPRHTWRSQSVPGDRQAGLLQHRRGGSGEPRARSPPITRFVDEWAEAALDYVRGEAAGENARASVAALIGADPADVALIASVSAAAGLVAAQFGPAGTGAERRDRRARVQLEPFPVATAREQGLRGSAGPVPKRRARTRRHRVAASTAGRCWSRSAACRPRPGTVPISGRSARSRVRSARSCSSTVRSSSARCRLRRISDAIDVLATADHKFLLHAGRGLGYCYFSPRDAGPVHADQRGLEGRTRPVRELLRAGDGSLTDRVAFRQLDQLARGDRKRGGALGRSTTSARTRSTGRNRELAEPAPGIACRGRMDAGRSARGQSQHDRVGTAR